MNKYIIIMRGVPGSGKCHQKGTKILMYDGSIKNVECIKTDEQVMGDDSKERNVLSTTNGFGKLYKITPNKGEPFVVNENHILVLNKSGNMFWSHGKIKNIGKLKRNIEISVKDYLKKNNVGVSRLKLIRSGVEFKEKETSKYLTPYFLGLWLGDGTSANNHITTIDKEIIYYLHDYAYNVDADITITPQHKNKNVSCYAIVYHKKYNIYKNKKGNPIINKLRELNLINNKHIPNLYKINSRKKRLELLAGLIDSDGYYNKCCFNIVTKSDKLKDDILYLCKSLGFAAYAANAANASKIIKTIKSINFSGEYWSINISGNIDEVPTLLKRKQAQKRKMSKDVLVTGFNIEYVGEGEYYGFNIDKNNRYLMGDFTITHNSSISNILSTRFNAVVHSTDNYHIKEFLWFKWYKFDKKKLGYYHMLNYDAFMESVDNAKEMIVVDNTNVYRKLYMSYVIEGKENGYKIVDIKFEPNDIEVHMKRNVHNVPEKTVKKMINALKSNWGNKDFDISITIKKDMTIDQIKTILKEKLNG